MNENERLTRELRDRADQVGGHPIGIDDVKRSASRIRWQRRAGATAVAAAVLAVAAPVGLAVTGDGGDGGTPPVANPSPGQSSSPTPASPPAQPRKVTLSTDVPGGGEPRVPYVLDGRIIEPDGTAVDVQHAYTDVTRFVDGWLGLYADDEGSFFADVLSEDGSVERTFPSTWDLAVDRHGQQVAVLDASAADGELQLYDAESGTAVESWDLQDGVVVHPVGILDGNTVVYATDGPDPVTMVATPGQTQPLLGVITSGGVAAGSGLVTGMTKVDEMVPESCWNLFEAAGVPQWRKDRCDYTLGRFSPDERLMLGHPTYRDGPGDRVLAILDAETGRAFVEYNAEEMSLIADAVWEDETHVLATVYGEDGWHVMRLDTEGTMVDVSGPLPGAELETPVQFGAAP